MQSKINSLSSYSNFLLNFTIAADSIKPQSKPVVAHLCVFAPRRYANVHKEIKVFFFAANAGN
jgi:hypothetical protein